MCLAVPAKILSITSDTASRLATVDFQGTTMEISLDFLPEASTGDYVLIHAGYAINTLDEEEAAEVWDYLKGMEESNAELLGLEPEQINE